MTGHGNPDRYGAHLDHLVPHVSTALVAELEQVVALWRAAGWSDLAIGAVITIGQETYAQRILAVQALRRVV